MPHAIVLRTDHLGDCLLTTPLIRALSMAGYEVDLLFPAPFLPLFTANPHVARVLPLDPHWRRRWLGLAGTLREGRYDLLLLPNAAPWQLPLAGFLSGIPARIAMWAGVWGRIMGHRCLRSGLNAHPRPYADILLDMAREIGIPTAGMELQVAVERKRRGVGGSFRVGIHPGSGGSSCNLSPAAYAEFASLILDETDWQILLTGSAAEVRLLEHWPASLLASPRVINAVGKRTLGDLAEEIAMIDLLVVGSTGPLHLAAALGVPTLSPFCHRPALDAPVWGNQNANAVVIRPPFPRSCLELGKGNYCDFSGKISPRQMMDRARSILG